ncbi:hypothetical protein [Fulvimarina sp. MAC8]|uniref:hypothetical protein n=1 Tax=Fulvimarina sp. MAC8 TaxID=3162874 RepID=UPI0032ED4D57
MMMVLFAALWGFGEASLFFVVPDVLISFVAVRYGLTKALMLGGFAALAAAMAGAFMAYWGASDAEAAIAMLAQIPAIEEALIEATRTRLAEDGYWAVLSGAVTGVPYKIFAVLAGEAGWSIFAFALISIPIRFCRFALTAALAGLVGRILVAGIGMRWALAALCGFWILLYAYYFNAIG